MKMKKIKIVKSKLKSLEFYQESDKEKIINNVRKILGDAGISFAGTFMIVGDQYKLIARGPNIKLIGQLEHLKQHLLNKEMSES